MTIRKRLQKLAARRRALAPRAFMMEFRDYVTGRLCWRGGTEIDPVTGALVDVDEWFRVEAAP